mgnify:CR=1 FL=1
MKRNRRKRIKREQEKIKAVSMKKNTTKKAFKKSIFIILISLLFVGYLSYIVILITGIPKEDPLNSNGSSSYLLSKTTFDDLDKTLWIFEEGEGGDSKITEAFLIASNSEKSFLLNIYIPGWLYFASTEEDFGDALAVSNFKYAGEFLEEGRGIEYAIWQFEQMLGTKIDNYIWIGGKEQSLYSDIFGYFRDSKGDFNYDSSQENFTQDSLLLDSFVSEFSFLKIPLHPDKISGIGEGIVSNRNFMEVLNKISQTSRQLNGYEKHIIDLGGAEYVSEELSASGGVAYYFNSSAYDEVFREYLLSILDRELEKEQVKVEVYNGSGISGAAGQMARKIENSGSDVVRYENAPDLLERTILYVPDEERFKNSLSVVQEVVGTNVEVRNTRPDFMTTGDIIVVLGEDIEKMYAF